MIRNVKRKQVSNYLLFVDMIKSYSSALLTFLSNYNTKMHLNTSDPNTTEPAHTEWNNRPAPRPEPTR